MLLFYAKIISLIFFSFIGYIAGRYFNVCQKSIANIIIYLISPLFNFYIMATSEIAPEYLGLVPLQTLICLSVGIPALYIGQSFFKDSRSNLLALTLSVPNAGYFGIPLVLIFFGEKFLAHQLLIAVGTGFSVYTYGFYIMNRSKFNIKTCISKVAKVPIMYAVIIGFIFSKTTLTIPEFLLPSFDLLKGTYSVLGLMMIGIGIGKARKIAFDLKLISFAVIGKFMAYPIITFIFIFIDNHTLNILDNKTEQLFYLGSLMPLGINTINFAALTQEREAEAATLVLLSSVIACILIPLYLTYFLLV
jgi:hypothetical protein